MLLTRGVEGASKGAAALSAFLVILMTLHVVAEVISRKLFNTSLVGTIEFVSFYYMVVITFLPLGWVQAQGEHIEVDIFVKLMPTRPAAAITVFALLLTFAVIILLLCASISRAWEQTFQVWETVRVEPHEILVWPGRWALVIGFGTMAAMLLVQAVRILRHPEQAAPPDAAVVPDQHD